MKIDRISYSKLLPTGVYANERIGFEAELSNGDNPEKCMDELRDTVELLHKKYNPQYYMDTFMDKVSIPEIKTDTKESATQRIIDQINQCSDEKVLDSFRLLASKNPELKIAFETKLKSFK